MKSPHGQAFVKEVMRRLKCKKVRDLSRLLELAADEERKLYKWNAGEMAPNFRGTVKMLAAIGFLTPEARRVLLDEPYLTQPEVDAAKRLPERVAQALRQVEARGRAEP